MTADLLDVENHSHQINGIKFSLTVIYNFKDFLVLRDHMSSGCDLCKNMVHVIFLLQETKTVTCYYAYSITACKNLFGAFNG